MRCDRCGKEMTNAKGTSMVGVSIQLDVTKGSDVGFAQTQLGKYELGRRYDFCWECWLDSLFGYKPAGG